MAFDPDAYLAEKAAGPPPAFNPDDYLSSRIEGKPAAQSTAPNDSAAYFEEWKNVGRLAKGLGENALTAATATIGEPAAWVARQGALAGNAMGLTDADPEAVRSSVRNFLVSRPNSPTGKDIEQGLGEVMAPVGRAMNWFDQKVGNAVESIPGVGPMLNEGARGVANVAEGALSIGPLVAPFMRKPAVATEPWNTSLIERRSSVDNAESISAAKAQRDLSTVSPELRARIQAAQDSAMPLNETAIDRHIEADSLPVPVQLLPGQARGDPHMISDEMNNRGRNQALGTRFNDQNRALAQNVQVIRDQAGPDVFSTNAVEHGDTLIAAYRAKAAEADEAISARYQALKDANNGAFPVSAPRLLADATEALHQQLLFDHAPPSVMRTLDRLSESNNMTFENFESLRTNLARIQRTAMDGNERAAAGVIRQAMENMPLAPGAEALKPLADQARAAARAQFQALDADPAYKAAVNDTVPPDRFVQKFITSPAATRDGVAIMRENLGHDPVATQTMGVAALDHLRTSAGLDPMYGGNFSQAGFNKNLNALSPKLSSLLDTATTEQLEKLGNVARYTQAQPRGSYVNNSGTFVAAAKDHAANAAEGLANVKAGGVPIGTWVRGALNRRSDAAATQRLLEPGAGITD